MYIIKCAEFQLECAAKCCLTQSFGCRSLVHPKRHFVTRQISNRRLISRPLAVNFKSIFCASLFLASPAPGSVVRPDPEDGGGVQRARGNLAQWLPEQGRM